MFFAANKLRLSTEADRSRVRTAYKRIFSPLFSLSSLPCVSKAASSANKIGRNYPAYRCIAVFAEQIFVKIRKKPQGIQGISKVFDNILA